MYPYLLVIVVDGLRFTTRHKTYGEALGIQLELETRLGDRVQITLIHQADVEGINW